jgi:hypothetical protein
MPLDRITTTIMREYLAEIVAGTKRVEYREIKSYRKKRLESRPTPFELRLINGMRPHAPEVTVLVDRVRTNRREGVYELHIKKVLRFSHWDKRRRVPRG